MKVLFIGGTGVISSSVSSLCIERGCELYLLNRGKSFRKEPEGATIIKGDINNTEPIRRLLEDEKFDSVVDWIAFNDMDVKRDYELFRDITNQYIFISSASVYSPKRKLPITEETPLENPYWAYSRAKIDCENFLMKMYREKNFPVTVVRPSHTYDKSKNPLRGDYLSFFRMKNGKPLIIHDDGNSKWTLTHTKDFAKGFTGLIGNPKTLGETYQITSDEVLTWNQIAKTLAEKSGYELNVEYVPSEFIAKYDEEWGAGLLGDKANDAVFDNSKIRSIVPEFNAAIPFEQGAGEIANWFAEPRNQIVNKELDELNDTIITDYKKMK